MYVPFVRVLIACADFCVFLCEFGSMFDSPVCVCVCTHVRFMQKTISRS